jgi:hypothetical protein
VRAGGDAGGRMSGKVCNTRTTWLPVVTALALCSFALAESHAEVGWRYVGDLNMDGIPDRLESGPQEFFGNAGGIYLLTLSSDKGPQRFLLYGSWRFVPEIMNDGFRTTFRLWTYWRSGISGGSLICHSVIDGKVTTTRIAVVHGPEGSTIPSISDKMMSAVFSSTLAFDPTQIENYTPPSIGEFGLDWGRASP